MSERNENKVYIIPPDFIQSGTLFGGLVKFRNALEAAVLAFLAGFPVLKLHIGLTAKIIILCLTALPLGVFPGRGGRGRGRRARPRPAWR